MKKTEIRDFLKLYDKKLVTDEDIKTNKIDYFFNDYRDRIKFRLNVYISNPNMLLFDYHGETLFELDSEDLEYLKTKYSKKICEEFNHNLAELKKEYSCCGELNKTVDTPTTGH